MIKRYENFINEYNYYDIEKEYHSIGEYVEEVSKGNDYLKSIVSNYINDVDTDIRISNAVNLLEDFDKKQLFNRIFNYLKNGGEEEKDVDIITNVYVNESVSDNLKGGKNLFLSFLKCITALGLKNIARSGDRDEYLFHYESSNINVKIFKSIMNRFKSLNMFADHIEYTHNECGVYFGIKYDLSFEYGFITDKEIPIGHFKVTKGNLNWLLLLQSQSANSLKKDIVSLNIKELILFGKISIELSKYNVKYKTKVGPIIKDGVITFGYTGVGKWDGDTIDQLSLTEIKENFKKWLSKFRWCDSLLLSVSFDHPYIYFNLKLK